MDKIDTTETLTRKFQTRARTAIDLAEMARQARGAAARWSKRASAWAGVGEFSRADDADTECQALGRLADTWAQEASALRTYGGRAA